MTKLKSLLIGSHPHLAQALPFLLFRAGFEIDAVTAGTFVNYGGLISRHTVVAGEKDLPKKLDEIDLDAYDLIVPFDDQALQNIRDSNLPLKKKLKLLPVLNEKDFQHLGSKIALSEILNQAQITTPPFLEALGLEQVIAAAEKLTFPVMVKVDFSGGGGGVFECKNQSDIAEIDIKHFALPLLVQKKIAGCELDLTAFYQNSQLLHFGYSWFEKVVSKFGPSSLRTYEQLGNSCDEKLFLTMQQLGKVLGADGFVKISAIKCEQDGELYFIEADMRPNIWIDFTKFIGDDLALKIANWFEKKAVLQFPISINSKFPTKLKMAHFLRTALLDILFNRYNVLGLMSVEDFRRFWCAILLPKMSEIWDAIKLNKYNRRRFKSVLKIAFTNLNRRVSAQ